jgi:membrane protein DedA with SNARE-associated domain
LLADSLLGLVASLVGGIPPVDTTILIGAMVAQALKEIGIPSPGVTQGALMYAGIKLMTGDSVAGIAIMLAIVLGSGCGSAAAYSVGRFVGLGFVKRYGKYIRLSPENLGKIKNKLLEKAVLAVILGRFVPALMAPMSIKAGLVRMPIAKYAAGAAIAVMIWELFFVGLGAITGKVLDGFQIPGIDIWLPAMLAAAVMVFLVITGILWGFRRIKNEPIETLHLETQDKIDK